MVIADTKYIMQPSPLLPPGFTRPNRRCLSFQRTPIIKKPSTSWCCSAGNADEVDRSSNGAMQHPVAKSRAPARLYSPVNPTYPTQRVVDGPPRQELKSDVERIGMDRIGEMIMGQNQHEDRMQLLREQEEEREIDAQHAERTNNRKIRHARRKSTNNSVRKASNTQMISSGHYGRSPHVRRDSVIAWKDDVQSPLRVQSERRCFRETPLKMDRRLLDCIISESTAAGGGSEYEDSSSTEDESCGASDLDGSIEASMYNILSSLEDEQIGSNRTLMVDRLASIFSIYFFMRFSNLDPSSIELDEREADVMRVLKKETDKHDVLFFIDGLSRCNPKIKSLLMAKK
eukprot:GHVH01001209.1.p1 GENE.GHVH01001209.1~~GHVH01001209.1.p1  ORF type:complete len:344 (+),score=48.77 GHVH01001209.1:216-1247(+)